MRRTATLAFLTATIALAQPVLYPSLAHPGCVENGIQEFARVARIDAQLEQLGASGKQIEGLADEGGKVAVWSKRLWRFAVKKVSGQIPSYQAPPVPAPARLSLKDIHFMQDWCSNRTKDGKFTVLENALNFRSGRLRVETLPPIHVWRDQEGRIWSLDHRRLASMRLAGNIENAPVVWATRSEVETGGFKFDNHYDGKSIQLELGTDRALRVGDP